MENTAQCVIICQDLGASPEQELTDKLKEIIQEKNTEGISSCSALHSQGYSNVASICVGPNRVGVLLKNGGICLWTTQTKVHQVQPPAPTPSQGNNPPGGTSQSANRANLPKFRRVMLTAGSFDRFRRGERVMIDRGRPVIPAASVPEELIAQAQVVLQGKPREVIVRELQRTNLNVNEAVNNLLSRDDDEDDDGEGSEVMLPEELLSLLDPASGGAHPLLDADFYGPEFEYVLGRDMARRRAEKEKEKKSKENNGNATPTTKSRLEFDDGVSWWTAEEKGTPDGVERFEMMTATGTELLAVTNTGILYSWNWLDEYGGSTPNLTGRRLIQPSDPIVQITSSRLRVMCLLQSGQICSWLDPNAVGERACQATELRPISPSLTGDEKLIQIMVSDHLAVARSSHNAFHWMGLYPFNERPKMWEKERSKSKKHVTFDTGSSDIKEGSEVRTKSSPVYAAGSVAINFNGWEPMIGVLMESVWTLTEMARFRLIEPRDFDTDFPLTEPAEGASKSPIKPADSRKRASTTEVFEKPTFREEAWGVCDVIWIHEQQAQDVAIVKIVDGAYVGVEYSPSNQDMTFASSLSGTVVSKDSNSTANTGKMRLMRKDELCLISPKTKTNRSPRVQQKEPLKFSFSVTTPRKVVSAVAESTGSGLMHLIHFNVLGIRVLTDKRGVLYITRCSVEGKILSEHYLPVFPPSLYGHAGEPPSLLNYGEDSLLLLKDGNGAIHPLVRDAQMGFREPQALNLPQVRHFGFQINLNAPATGKSGSTREFSLIAITGPRAAAADIELPSLSQTILFCDTDKLKYWLDAFANCEDQSVFQQELLGERSDSGSNILHTAVRLSVAAKNKDDADPGTTHGIRLREEETKMARDEARELDQKWQRLIRARPGADIARPEEPSVIQAAPMQENVVQSPEAPKEQAQDMPAVEKAEGVVSDPKERQKKAIEIVKMIVKHPAVKPVLEAMLSHRDYLGLTPFQAAVNIRAYGAAIAIWQAIKELVPTGQDGRMSGDTFDKMVFPAGSKNDDNPVFLLCYNDTCSFTWTGEEHINQDIFECRTCGLTGSLCCCTECAYTCHRNHDCKLKRTSPTAYCDCWEKCPCKALVAGNQEKREALLFDLVSMTTLYQHLNCKGEHVMLFLARTLGRQMSEQSNSNKRRRHPASTSHTDPAAMPEHDLEPPKFAKFAIEACIMDWRVLNSLIEIGRRNVQDIPAAHEDILCLNSQDGSTHLDKFVYTLLSKCGDAMVTLLIESIISTAKEDPRPEGFEPSVARIIRSIMRIYILLMLMSPNAAAIGIKGKNPHAPPTQERRIAAISVSGLFQIVRPSESGKESKQTQLTNVILRCREVLMRLCIFSVEQAALLADTLVAPVRYGIMRPSCSIQIHNHNHDPLEVLEKFLNSECDLTTLLLRLEGEKDRPRKRKPSRRDGDANEDDIRDFSDDSDDSDGDEPPSRRHNSQSNETVNVTSDNVRRKTGISVVYDDDELTDPGSSSSDSEQSEEETDAHVMVDDGVEDEDTGEEDDHDERYGENSEGDQENDQNYDDAETDEQRNENDYPSPTYEPADPQDGRGDRDDIMDDEERRNAPEQPLEDEESTRDAVHSEDSSTDNAETGPPVGERAGESNIHQSESQRERPPATLADRTARRTQMTARRIGNLAWAGRARSEVFEDDEDTDERSANATTTSTTSTRAPPSSQVNSGSGSSPTEQSKKTNTENTPSIAQTSQQLSLAFSFTMRLFCDLMTSFHERRTRSCKDLRWEDEDIAVVMGRVLMHLNNVWNWMYVILDRMEAQLRFGNALLLAGADPKVKPSKKKDQKKDGKPVEEVPATSTRRDTMEYIIATMRGQADEAGDDYPLVDVDALRSLVFVFDAYLSYHETLEACKAIFAARNIVQGAALTVHDEGKQTMSRFFRRSNSMCFPGSSLTEAWDTLGKTNGRIPLADKPYLLSSDVEQSTLFAPPPNNLTYKEYVGLSQANGIPSVMNMNMATLEHQMKHFESVDAASESACNNDVEMQEVEQEEDIKPPVGMIKFTVQEVCEQLKQVHNTPHNQALTRWKNVVQFIAKECHHELVQAYGGEIGNNHLLSAVAKFPVRQAMFRKAMDKFRAQQTKDIAFEVHRDAVQLIRDAVFQLNQAYVRRLNTPKGRDDPPGNISPLASGRVKVRFYDEPGEGTGVARSFYTALAEALMNSRKFPFEQLGWEGSEDYLYGTQAIGYSPAPSSTSRDRTIGRLAIIRDRANASAILSRKRPSKRSQLSADSEPFIPEDVAAAETRYSQGQYKSERVSEQITRQRSAIAEAVYIKVRHVRPQAAARIAGMLVELPVSVTMHCLSSPDLFKQYLDDAVSSLLKVGRPADLAMLSDQQEKRPKTEDQEHPADDDAPLFSRTYRRGLFAPVPGKMSPMRLNAFRNVGRVMGLCLSQGELFPLRLNRHVFKCILGRDIHWLDVQFYDPTLWESLRQLMDPENGDDFYDSLMLTFTVQINDDSEGSDRTLTIPLKENGDDIPVTKHNVVEYVYKFAEMKLLGANNVQCYSAIRQGIADVIPLEALDGLSAEDMRLLLCGADNVCVSALQAVTTFSDESHAASETLDRFKGWFWSVVDSLSPIEKQELIFFWTGAPSLATSPESLQPQPTVMVRPPDDVFLPTANTCISRLYVPLYSSKKLLRTKLQLAIKAKNFGFV